MQTAFAYNLEILFASPNERSLSCATTGIFNLCAAITTGRLTYPPLEKTTFGFNFFNNLFASLIAFINLKGINKFFSFLFLSSFTVEISK